VVVVVGRVLAGVVDVALLAQAWLVDELELAKVFW